MTGRLFSSLSTHLCVQRSAYPNPMQPWQMRAGEESGDAEPGLSLDNGALVLFTRGNLMLTVRSAGLQPLDARSAALQLDHWLVGAEDLIVGPPKGLRASRLDMTQADQRNLFRFGVLLLPEVLLIGGIVAWLRRRSL